MLPCCFFAAECQGQEGLDSVNVLSDGLQNHTCSTMGPFMLLLCALLTSSGKHPAPILRRSASSSAARSSCRLTDCAAAPLRPLEAAAEGASVESSSSSS